MSLAIMRAEEVIALPEWVPPAERRAATLEDAFVLLTGEEGP